MKRSLYLIFFVFLHVYGIKAYTQPQSVKQLYQKGVSEFKRGRYLDALQSFMMAKEIAQTPEILWSIARCYEEMGDYENALESFQEFIDFTNDKSARAKAKERIEGIKKRFSAVLIIIVPDKDVRVKLGDRDIEMGYPEKSMRLMPGTYNIVASKDGFQTYEEMVSLRQGEIKKVRVELKPILVDTPRISIPPPTPKMSVIKTSLFFGGLGVLVLAGLIHIWGVVEYGDTNNEIHTYAYKRSLADKVKQKYVSAYCLYGLGISGVIMSFVVPTKDGKHPLYFAIEHQQWGTSVMAKVLW